MPRYSTRIPKYRLHKPSGQAVVTLSGRDVYLGKHGSPESKAEYNRLVAEWQLNGRGPTYHAPPGECSIDELIIAYLKHVEDYYVKNGRPTSTQAEARRYLDLLHHHYGHVAASCFGPLAFKSLQSTMVEEHNWARRTINKATGQIKRMFKWAIENELIDAVVFHRLQVVSGLRKGRSLARESEPVVPAPDEQVEAVLRHVSNEVAAMIQLQRFTGMRPAEVTVMRLCDIDCSEKVWIYMPATHKTEHHGKQRRIFLGPKAQLVLVPYLQSDPNAFLFSPAKAEETRLVKLHGKRRTRLSCGNRPGTNRANRPNRKPGSRYTTCSYGRAITRACEQAFPAPQHLAKIKVPGKKGHRWETNAEWRKRLGEKKWQELKAWRKAHHWHPNQLRHNAATYLRKEFGIEAARVVLGHSSAAVTEIYAEMDFDKAKSIMSRVG
jgi:integrase